jgi:hypothetical protein
MKPSEYIPCTIIPSPKESPWLAARDINMAMAIADIKKETTKPAPQTTLGNHGMHFNDLGRRYNNGGSTQPALGIAVNTTRFNEAIAYGDIIQGIVSPVNEIPRVKAELPIEPFEDTANLISQLMTIPRRLGGAPTFKDRSAIYDEFRRKEKLNRTPVSAVIDCQTMEISFPDHSLIVQPQDRIKSPTGGNLKGLKLINIPLKYIDDVLKEMIRLLYHGEDPENVVYNTCHPFRQDWRIIPNEGPTLTYTVSSTENAFAPLFMPWDLTTLRTELLLILKMNNRVTE